MTDWAPGDLALCVRNGVISNCPCGFVHLGINLIRGRVYRVVAVSPGLGGCRHGNLILDGTLSGLPSRFRKLEEHTPDAEDREIISIMRGDKILESGRMDSPSTTASGSGSGGTSAIGAATLSLSFHENSNSAEAQHDHAV